MSIQHCFPNCRCFWFKTNRWSTNMCCSGSLCRHYFNGSFKFLRLSFTDLLFST